MGEAVLTEIMKQFYNNLGNAVDLLQPVALQLLNIFFMYEVVTGLLFAPAGTNPLTVLKDKLKIAFCLGAVIYFFKDLMEVIRGIFDYFYQVVSKSDPKDVVELPQDIISTGFQTLKQLLSNLSYIKPATWVLLIGFVVGAIIFAKIAIMVGQVVLEYFIMGSLLIVLVPFMMFEKLRFAGDKVIATLINLNMKIFVIRYLHYCFSSFLSKELVIPEGGSSTQYAFYWLTAMGMLGVMVLKGNEMAQTLVSGVTSFGSSSELINGVKSGMKKVGGAVSGSITAGKIAGGVVGGAKSGAGAGKSKLGKAIGAIKEGFKGGREAYKERGRDLHSRK